jgi:hypothetical protein
LHLTAIVVAILLVIAGYVYIFKALNEHTELQQEINAKLPSGRKFEPLFWWFGTWLKLRDLQEELLPETQRLKRFHRFSLIGFVLFVSGMLLLGFGLGK